MKEVAKSVLIPKSESLNQIKKGFKVQQQREILGEKEAAVPKGANKNLQLLNEMNGKNLIEVNEVICNKYKTELTARRDGSQFVIDVDDGIPVGVFRNMPLLSMMMMR